MFLMKKNVLSFLLIFAIAMSTIAQKAVVESFETASMDLTAQKYARVDLNGVKCAVVKVQVIAPGVEFSGNIIGTTEKHASEYWVYMTQGTKMVKIAAETFLPIMYTFPEPLQSGVTYVLTLQAPQTVNPAATTVQTDPGTTDIDITSKYRAFRDYSSKKCGYRYNGNVVIPARYDETFGFHEGLACVKINYKYGFIDKDDKMVIPVFYDYAGKFSEGLAMVGINCKYGFIDKTGKVIIPLMYDEIVDLAFSNGKARVRLNGREFFIDHNGNEVQ